METREFTTLVVDDEKPIRDTLCAALEMNGYPTIQAADGSVALEVFRNEQPALIVTDIQMPNMNGLELLRAVKKEAPDTCVVIMTGYGTEETAIDAIRFGASNYLKKPINLHEFIYAMSVLADFIVNRKISEFDCRSISREQRTVVIGNDLRRIYAVVYELTKTASCHVADIDSVRIGLLEMITNAIEHGNLGITYAEKQTAIRQGRLQDLYRERSLEPGRRDSRVTIFSDFTPERVIFTVKDEGVGFEWKQVLEGKQDIMDLNGRGIFLTTLYMDEVIYNIDGNEVTLVKNLAAVTRNARRARRE
ncbi:MAG: ATP-binding protein [Thermodesulfovibrionales bacterium]